MCIEGFKTFGKLTDYHANIFNECGKNVVIKVPVIVVESLTKATANTLKDVVYGINDTLIKLFSS